MDERRGRGHLAKNRATRMELGINYQEESKMNKRIATALVLTVFTTFGTCETALADTFSIQETLEANLLTKELKSQSNVEVAQKRLGTNLYQAESGVVKIKLSIKGVPAQGRVTGISGNGVLIVGNETYPFSLMKEQSLYINRLSNGHEVIWGPLDSYIKDKMGDSTLSLGIVIDRNTNQAQVSAVDGDLSSGYVPMIFGNLSDIPISEVHQLFRKR